MDLKLLEKFFKKQCCPEEVKIVLEWFSKEDLDSTTSAQMKTLWDSVDQESKLPDYDPHKLLKDIHSKIDIDKEAYHSNPKRRKILERQSINPHYIIKASAFIMLLIIITTCIFYFYNQRNSHSDWISQKASVGLKKKITLADGTIVYLNANSTLQFPKSFYTDKREVELTGEAFFEVVKDPQKPFIIKSGKIITTVLGASFNVNTYDNSDEITVSLVSGKVEVKKNNWFSFTTHTITAGNKLVYNKLKGNFSQRPFNINQTSEWKRNISPLKTH